MKALTLAFLALALTLASPGDAKDIIDTFAGDPFVAPAPQPDRAHLKRGDSGGDVPILQKALNNHGEHLRVDGIFGRQTEKAVKAFQTQSGLELTGEVDSGTWSALAAKPAPVRNPAHELEMAKRAADQANAQATELARRVASLSSELEKANTRRNELEVRLEQANLDLKSAQAQFTIESKDIQFNMIDPENACRQRDLVAASVYVGDTLMAQGDLSGALTWYRDGLAGADRLAKTDSVWQNGLSPIFIKVGDVLMAQGNLAEALQSYREGLEVATRLAKSQPESVAWQHDLAASYAKVGDALAAGKNFTDALRIFRDSLQIRQRLAEADSSNTDRQRDFALIQGRVAVVLAEQGDASRALDMLRQGRAVLARLKEHSPDDVVLLNDLAWFDAEIAKLDQASAPGLEAAQPKQAVR